MPPAAVLDVDGTPVDSNYQHVIAWYRCSEARALSDGWTSSGDFDATPLGRQATGHPVFLVLEGLHYARASSS